MNRWFMWFLYIGVALLLFVGGTFLMLSTSWERDYKYQISRVKKKGIPLTGTALTNRYRKRHPDQKTYSGYTLPAGLKKIYYDYDDMIPAKKAKDAAVEVYPRLKKHKKQVDTLIREEVKHAKLQFEKGYNTPLQHIQGRILESRVLKMCALANYFNGNEERALRILRKGYEISEKMRGEQVLISFLVHLYIYGYMNRVLEEIVKAPKPVPEEIRTLFPYLKKEFVRAELNQVVEGELSLMLITFRKLMDDSKKVKGGGLGGGLLKKSRYVPDFVTKKWLASYIQRYFPLLEEVPKPYYECRGALRKMKADLRKIKNSWMYFTDMISALAMPGMMSLRKDAVRKEAAAEVLRAGFRWRLKQQENGETGVSPPDLSSMLDPATGKQLRLKKGPKTFMIYSLGPNQKDDGGAASLGQRNPDIGIELPVGQKQQETSGSETGK